jgi:hypothetical protein
MNEIMLPTDIKCIRESIYNFFLENYENEKMALEKSESITNQILELIENINNVGGLIQGKEVFTQAKNDINNIGGQIRADQTLFLDAGNNINSSSATIKTENKQGAVNLQLKILVARLVSMSQAKTRS